MKHYLIYSLSGALLLLLSACKVSKDIATPKNSVPTAYTGAAASDTTNMADLSWKTFFSDASLQKLVDSALLRNYDMQIALKNVESANQSLKQAKQGWLPQLNLNVGASSNTPSKNSLNGSLTNQYLGTNHIEDFTANIGLSWEIDIWRKIRNQKKVALSSYLQTTEARKAIQTAIVSGVATGFYNLLLLDEQLIIAQKNLALNDSTIRIIRLRQTAGQVTSLAVQQAEAQQMAAAQLVSQLEQTIRLQENALSILAGRFPGKIERSNGLSTITLNEIVSTGVPSQMLSRRPDVKAQELNLSIQNARVGIAKAGFYPAIQITANSGLNAYKAANWFTIPASLFGTVVGGITQPLFQHRRIKTQYKVAKIDREKAVLQFRQTVLNAVGEVSDALIKAEKLDEQQLIASKRVGTLQEATQNAVLLFKSGMANYLEVISVQGSVLQSELDLATIKYGQLHARIDLYRALGGGWK
ncbi:MAG: TolC family protein [Bacteroidota bacterium]